MSNTEKDKEFYERADKYIALANEQSTNAIPGKVSATFLYAAARFNTFIAAAGAESSSDFAAKKEDLMEFFMSEYKKMLEEHFADYGHNFDKYLGRQNKN